ncbi:MAG: hypothetical protein H0X41_14585 [Chitinophagaceae bacterium]|nr:hypothetical protein [Chitinophagaceae bacterium]
MAIYYPSGCEDAVPEHICDPCGKKEQGRVRSIAYIHSSVAFINPSSPVEWRAGILSGKIIIIPKVIGSYDGGAEVESAGYGDQSTELTGYNHSLNFKDPNYSTNADFYNALKRSRSYNIAWRTSSQTHISNGIVSAIPKNPVTEDLTSAVVWDVTNKWASEELSEPFDTPPGIFDECFAVS